MQSAGKLIKAEKWWNDKAPPVLGLAFFLLAVSDGEIPLVRSVLTLLAFMVTFIGVAGFGHVINDLCDVDHDRAAGKHNTMAGRPRAQVAAILLLLLAVAWLPWLWLPANRWNLSLIALQLLLLTLYAAPPFRFKARAVSGVVTDALYAYTVPALITWTTFADMAGEPTSRPFLLAALVPWSLFAGLRGMGSCCRQRPCVLRP
jgi:4-hydroxybenzoate polyprenyltransferase